MFILDCNEIKQMCYNVQPILYVVKYIINVLQWTVPLILIVLGTWDMVKAVTKAEDEKAISEARSNLIKRIIYGVVIFLVPFFVSFILGLIESNINLEDDNLPTAWIECWNNANDIKNSYFDGCTDIFEPTEDERYHEAPVVKGECRDASGNLKATSVTENECRNLAGEGYQFNLIDYLCSYYDSNDEYHVLSNVSQQECSRLARKDGAVDGNYTYGLSGKTCYTYNTYDCSHISGSSLEQNDNIGLYCKYVLKFDRDVFENGFDSFACHESCVLERGIPSNTFANANSKNSCICGYEANQTQVRSDRKPANPNLVGDYKEYYCSDSSISCDQAPSFCELKTN